MSRHDPIDNCCSMNCCLYKSESERPSVQQIITEGTKIDRLYLGKFLPLREKKLLRKLIKTRAVYNDVVDELILSHSDYSFSRSSAARNTRCSCCSSELDAHGRKIKRHGEDTSKIIHEALKMRRLAKTRRDSSTPCKCDFIDCTRIMSKNCLIGFKDSAGSIKRKVDRSAKKSLKEYKNRVKEITKGNRKHIKQTPQVASSSSSTTKAHVISRSTELKRTNKVRQKIGASKAPRLSASKSVALPKIGSKTITRSVSADFQKEDKGKKKRLIRSRKDRRYPERCFCTLSFKAKMGRNSTSKESMTSHVRRFVRPPSSSKSQEMKQNRHQRKTQIRDQQQKAKVMKLEKQLASKESMTFNDRPIDKPLFMSKSKSSETKQKQRYDKAQVREQQPKKKVTKHQEAKTSITSKSSATEERKFGRMSVQVHQNQESSKRDKSLKQTKGGGGILAKCMCTLKLKAKATKDAAKELFGKSSIASQNDDDRKLKDKRTTTKKENESVQRSKHTQDSGRALKRCFCTLKLLAKRSTTSYDDHQIYQILKPPSVRKRETLSSNTKKENKLALPSNICDSRCSSYDCIPDQCLEIIKKRKKAHIQHVPKTGQKTKNRANVSTLRQSRENKTQPNIVSKTHESGDVAIKERKSSSSSRIRTRATKQMRGSQGDVKSSDISVYVKSKKHKSKGSTLKRCICTLKLNISDKLNKNHEDNFYRGTETPLTEKRLLDTSNLSKSPKTKRKIKPRPSESRVRSSRVDTGTIPYRPKRKAVSSMTGGFPAEIKQRKGAKVAKRYQPELDEEFYGDESGSRQVVRISSTFSFNLEFSRKTIPYPSDEYRAITPPSSSNRSLPKRCFCTLDLHKGNQRKPNNIHTVNRMSTQQTRMFHGQNKLFMMNNNQLGYNAQNNINSSPNHKSKIITFNNTEKKRYLNSSKKHKVNVNNRNYDRCCILDEVLSFRRQNKKTSNIKYILKNIVSNSSSHGQEASPRRPALKSHRHYENNERFLRNDYVVARVAIGENIEARAKKTNHKNMRKGKNLRFKNLNYMQLATSYSKYLDKERRENSTSNRVKEIKTIYPYIPKKFKADLDKSGIVYALKRHKSEIRPPKLRYDSWDETPLKQIITSKHPKKDVKNRYKSLKHREPVKNNLLWYVLKLFKCHSKNKYKQHMHKANYDQISNKKGRCKNKVKQKRKVNNTIQYHKHFACFNVQAEYDRSPCCCNKDARCFRSKLASGKSKPCPKFNLQGTTEPLTQEYYNVPLKQCTKTPLKNSLKPSTRQHKCLNLTPFETLPAGTTLPPYDASSQKPLFEMRLKAGTLDLVNSDEVYGQIAKLNKLSANRARDYLRQLKKLHGEGCCCCICKAVKDKVISEEAKSPEWTEEAKKKECIQRKKKERDLRPKSVTEWIMAKQRQPCVCRIKKCMREREKMTELEILRHRGLLAKPCICGTKICADEWKKKLASMKGLSARDIETKVDHRKKLEKQAKKLTAYKKRLKEYQKEDQLIRKQQEEIDKRRMELARKSAKDGPCAIIIDSATDIARTGFTNVFRLVGGFFRKLISPVKTFRRMKHRVTDPGPRILTELENVWIGSGIKGTMQRTAYRAGASPCSAKCKKCLEKLPVGVYLMNRRDPKRRRQLLKDLAAKKRANEKLKQEPRDFECSLFVSSLRKRPFLKLYYLCPWFYPHCISIISVLKSLVEAGLFCLAIIVWSPCILLMELCRGLMCCTMCTG